MIKGSRKRSSRVGCSFPSCPSNTALTRLRLPAQRWIEFGAALHGLYTNLKTIESILARAERAVKEDYLGPLGPPAYDLGSLHEIIGNFKDTLIECRELLNDERKFPQKNGIISNIVYNIDVDPHVIQLTERLAFHNTKILFVLKPFELHLQSYHNNLSKELHQDLSERLSKIEQLVVAGLDLKDEAISMVSPRDVEVPLEIAARFAQAYVQGKPKDLGDRPFADPLKKGLEAFFHHFSGLAQPLDSGSYLRLLKSIWVMDKIIESDEWGRLQITNPGGLYDRCVRKADRKLREECSRVDPSQMPLPSLLLQGPDDSFAIWPAAAPLVKATQTPHLGVLLEIPILPDPASHMLRIVRNIDGTLGVEDTFTTTTEASGTLSSETRIQMVNIDPKSAYFIPIYATPSQQPALTVKLQSSQLGINGVTPEFQSLEDLLKLQHLITGYKCAKRKTGVTVVSLAEGQGFPQSQASDGKKSRKKRKEQLVELGNIQMWQKSPFPEPTPSKEPRSDQGRRFSAISSPTAIKSIESSMSYSTLDSSASAHVKSVSLGSTGTGLQFTQPDPPCLVLFLKECETGLLSFLVLDLDESTFVNPMSCDCGSKKKKCRTSVLERVKMPLLARRFYAREGLNSWNLTAAGEHWPAGESGAIRTQNMYWLRIDFPRESDLNDFNDKVSTLVRLYARKLAAYRAGLQTIRGTHIVSR